MRKLVYLLLLLCWHDVSAAGLETRYPVTLRIHNEQARQMSSAGEFSNWDQLPMVQQPAGTWFRTLYLAPGDYAYKLVRDGETWFTDPANPASTERDGSLNSLLQVKNQYGWVPPAVTWNTLVYTNADAEQVCVAGTFNGWDMGSHALSREGDAWSIRLTLEPGEYTYKFVVDGTWRLDPGNPLHAASEDGAENSLLSVPTREPVLPQPARTLPLGDLAVTPGAFHLFTVPASQPAWDNANRLEKLAGNARRSFPAESTVDAALLLPEGFRPDRPWPILIVSGPDGWPNTDHLYHCFTLAAEAGYVAIAGDGIGSRWYQAEAVLHYLHRHWPASRLWPVAFAGFSGGAKVSGLLAAQGVKLNYRVIGTWLGGCNEDYLSRGMDLYKPSPMKFRSVPIYIASGTTDEIATPEQCGAVRDALAQDRFQSLRFEPYEGGHHPVPPDKVLEGLLWFRQQAGLLR